MKNVAMMTLAEIEDEIEATYKWWAEMKPGVKPQEVGRLADLWRAFEVAMGR